MVGRNLYQFMKVNFNPTNPRRPIGRVDVWLYFLFNLGGGGGWVVNATPRPLYSPGETRYPLHWRLGGPPYWCGWVRKVLPPLVFDPRTVQPVACHYTD